MSTITLKATVGDYSQLFPAGAVKHCVYIARLLDAAEGDATIEVPHADEAIIKFMCEFLEQHKDDPTVPPEWEKQKPIDLTEWDKEHLTPIVGLKLIDLMKASDFLACQLMLNAVAKHVGEILVNKNELEVQEYFGVPATFTKEQEEEVKKKYPVPFY